MARDFYHQIIREALEKDGWNVTADPYYLTVLDTRYEIDLAAEQVFAAEKGTEKIAVEIKSFTKNSMANEFHSAVGQYLNYLGFLKLQEPDRILYLAVPQEAYDRFFVLAATEYIMNLYRINLIVCNVEEKEITLWQER